MRSSLVLAAMTVLSLVSGHNLINNAIGDSGGAALAFGVSSATSNSQSDTTTFKAGTKFGSTSKGAIDPAAQLAAVQKIAGSTLPQVASQITLTLHQINGDGAGPMACSIDTAATGTFVDTTVATNVPGTDGKSGASNQDFPLVVDVPAGTACTGTLGTVKNVCLVKCQNPAGPFGGVVPFQVSQVKGGGNGGGGAAGASGAAGAAAGTAAGAAAAGAAKGGNGAAKGSAGAKANTGGKKQGRWVAVDF